GVQGVQEVAQDAVEAVGGADHRVPVVDVRLGLLGEHLPGPVDGPLQRRGEHAPVLLRVDQRVVGGAHRRSPRRWATSLRARSMRVAAECRARAMLRPSSVATVASTSTRIARSGSGSGCTWACGAWVMRACMTIRRPYRPVTVSAWMAGPLWVMSARYPMWSSSWPRHQAGSGTVTSPASRVCRMTVPSRYRGSCLRGWVIGSPPWRWSR